MCQPYSKIISSSTNKQTNTPIWSLNFVRWHLLLLNNQLSLLITEIRPVFLRCYAFFYHRVLALNSLFICFLVCLFLSSPFILDKSVTMKKIGQAQPWPMFSNLYDEFHVRTFHSYTKCYSEWLVGKAQPMLLPWYHICGPEVIRESCFPCKKLLTPCPSIWWTPKHP